MDLTFRALVELGRTLASLGYFFVTVTPETHRRVNARAPALASSLRDVFGWSRPFERRMLPAAMLDLLADANALVESKQGLRSAVRFASLDGGLFVHSAFPTTEPDAVFFGPDTYRFCAAIARASLGAERVVDVGCGSGAGGIVARRYAASAVLVDINPQALLHARVNAALAGLDRIALVQSDVLAEVDDPFDVIIANPPYMRDELERAYRHGGGSWGEALSVRIVDQALRRLPRGGSLLLYTGTAVVAGDDCFLRAVRPLLERRGHAWRYEEVDPDVFGEELENPTYSDVERIAAVTLTVTKGDDGARA
ncbi:MAG: class I SAM-dependent methyltransferase [Myxococcota bacterium]|nr:class I SAM-dependent methyltransferase [Myxococcota bacterium]